MKFFRRFLKICAYTGIFLSLTILVFVLLTQTQFFKDRLRVILITTLTNGTNGEITIGTIRGNFFNGFTVDSLGIYYQGTCVARTRKVTFAYDVLPLLEKKLQLRYFIIEQPTLTFSRSASGDWNFLSVFKSSSDTTKGGSGWAASFGDVELKNGSLSLFDSLEQPARDSAADRHLNYHSFSLNNINLTAQGSLKPNVFDFHVLHASCSMPAPRFELTHFKGDFLYDQNGIRVQNVILQTSKSYLELDAKLRSRNTLRISSLTDLQHDSTAVVLKANNIDFGELKLFLPQVDFLNGSAALDLKSNGQFGDLDVRQLDVRVFQTLLRISGTVKNLHRPGQLMLNVSLAESKVAAGDITHLMPLFNIPALDSLGTVSVSAHFNGKPLDFITKIFIQSRAGNLETDAKLRFSDSLPKYDITFKTKELDLQKIFRNPSYSSSMTSHGTLIGEGISLTSLHSNFTLTVDSSRIRDLAVNHAEIFLHAIPQHLEATCSLVAQEAQLDLNMRGDFSNPDVPVFSSEVSLASFNFAPLLGNPAYQSDLTLRGSLRGSGKEIDDFNTDINLSILPSSFQHHDIPQDTFQLSLDQRDPGNKHLLLNSSIADLELKGSFDLDLVTAMVIERISNLLASVKNHALPPDSAITQKTSIHIAPHSVSQQNMKFDYQFQLKDLEPVATLFSKTHFDGHANLSGVIQSSKDNLSLTCTGNIGEFYLGSSGKGFILNNCSLDLELDSLRGEDLLENLSCDLNAQMGTANFNGIRLDNAHCKFHYSNTRGNLALLGIFDSLYAMNIIGETSIQPGSYVFDVDTLTADIGQFHWFNKQDVQFRINSDGTRILHAELSHNDATISATGVVHYSGGLEGTFTLNNFDLGELNLWLPHNRLQSTTKNFSGKSNLTLTVSGTLDNPQYQLGLTGFHVAYKQSSMGTVTANIIYRDTLATVGISLRGEGGDSLSSLEIKGTLPINLALTGVEDRFPDHEQSLSITSSNFDIGIFDPLIGEVDDLSGKLTADISVRGTPQVPDYSGSVQLRNVEFVFTPTNVEYLLSGDLQPSGSKITLRNFTLRNRPVNGKQGEANLKGTLTIQDYAISSFDVTALGQILLMSDATRKTGISLYGPLLTETDPAGLNLKGSFERPVLTGKLFVLDANLVFPPTRENTLTANQLTLNHVVIDDTSKRTTHSKKISKFYASTDPGNRPNNTRNQGQDILFIDRLRYNVTVETKGTTAIKMIFTPETNEELYSELEGKVSVINDQGTPTVNGEITVLPHSYYNFIKRFDATGSLNFIGPWDNPDLKIQATYEDYHVIDSLSKSGSNAQEKVIVLLDIKGNRYEPKLTMSMKVQQSSGTDAVDWSTQAKGGDVQSDAISFILTGKFKDELTSSDRRNLTSNVGSTASAGFTSNLLSGILTTFLRTELPFLRIRDASITYQGGTPDVRITGDILQGYLQFGGKILNNITNANVSYQVNLGEILKNSSIQNLFLEIQHRDSDLTEERKTDEARLYYRFSF